MHERHRDGYSAQVLRLRDLADAGVHTQQIATILGIRRETVWRLARRHDIKLADRAPRSRHGAPVIRGYLEWSRLYRQYGPSVCNVARAVGLNRTYVVRMLEKYGVRPPPEDIEDEEEEMVA